MTIEPGERVALLGPNGSGKTTLALHLNGLLQAQRGSVTVSGLALADDTLREIRRRVGLVFQDPNDQLFMHTVRDDVAFGPANLGFDEAEIERRVRLALDAVGAGEYAETAPHHLSGGEKRRAAMASVLSMDPEILVLDEPTSGIDPVGRHELADLLTSLPQTQLVVTHDLPFALATCPRSLVLDTGGIQVDTDTETLLDDPELLARHRLALPFGYRAGGAG
ncbi:MAG: ABC transporter ATP-binding protein [Actinomycetota bacterium]